ncbi:MAG TPA: hypothetical protein VG273_01225, partial [Bryobacteraceae bacterium]|nr:hypothetical protein [Bryobacteraceae bacterium]
MTGAIQFVGPDQALQLFGVRLVGVNAVSGKKLLFSIVFLFMVIVAGKILRRVLPGSTHTLRTTRRSFWIRQGVSIVLTLIVLVGLASIWFDDPGRLTTALGLVTAGLAFALQRVVTAVAGYFVILRGKTFNVGDRITMGGVRGDVVG